MEPLVSICCITYNHEKFIAQAIEGFLMQKTSFPFEVIIHDDASTDNTAAIIKEYEVRFPDIIKPIYQKVNQYSKGIKPSPTYVWPKAQGKYIALCEGDDYWIDSLKLQKQVDFLEKNPEFILCFTNGKVVDRYGKTVKEYQLNYDQKHIFIKEDLPFQAPTHTRVFRKFDIDLLPKEFYKIKGADTFLASWQVQYGKAKYLDFVSSSYRIHDGGVYSSLNEYDNYMQLIDTRISIIQSLHLFDHKNLKKSIMKYFLIAGRFINNNPQYNRYKECYSLLISIFNMREKTFLTLIFIKQSSKYFAKRFFLTDSKR